jgi:diadenosine tetraphosphatase ApaH/serine/threonine PP2A family protein phosphatase
MLAIISDIHCNLQALQAVLDHVSQFRPDRIYCLGDILGYGPSPVEVVDLIRDRCEVSLMGNHEWAVLHQPVGFNQAAREASLWQKSVLEPKWFSLSERRERWAYLKSLPEVHIEGEHFFVHASPQNHMEDYLLPGEVDDVLGEVSPKIRGALDSIEWVCFNGHTHHPGIISSEPRFIYPHQIEGSFKLKKGTKYIVNAGSVGQPRDGDSRACYITFEDDAVTYHRVEYDLEGTIALIDGNPRLHAVLGERLRKGA